MVPWSWIGDDELAVAFASLVLGDVASACQVSVQWARVARHLLCWQAARNKFSKLIVSRVRNLMLRVRFELREFWCVPSLEGSMELELPFYRAEPESRDARHPMFAPDHDWADVQEEQGALQWFPRRGSTLHVPSLLEHSTLMHGIDPPDITGVWLVDQKTGQSFAMQPLSKRPDGWRSNHDDPLGPVDCFDLTWTIGRVGDQRLYDYVHAEVRAELDNQLAFTSPCLFTSFDTSQPLGREYMEEISPGWGRGRSRLIMDSAFAGMGVSTEAWPRSEELAFRMSIMDMSKYGGPFITISLGSNSIPPRASPFALPIRFLVGSLLMLLDQPPPPKPLSRRQLQHADLHACGLHNWLTTGTCRVGGGERSSEDSGEAGGEGGGDGVSGEDSDDIFDLE
jgi:hypothetical protein